MVYLSDAVRPMSSPDLDAILRSARAFNESVGVTGLLVYAQQSFLQALEGDPDAVEQAFARTAASSQHRNLRCSPIYSEPARRFPSWSMGFSEAAPTVVAEQLLRPLVEADKVSAGEVAGFLLARFSSLQLPAPREPRDDGAVNSY